MGITKRAFGKSQEGRDVFLYEITNKNQVTLTVSDFGATWVHMLVPDRGGNLEMLYLVMIVQKDITRIQAFRRCNRKKRKPNRECKVYINGKDYQLAVNDNKNNLHSGPNWYRTRVWDVKEINQEKNSVTFGFFSPDGDQGFPGNFSGSVTYELTEENRGGTALSGKCRCRYHCKYDKPLLF